MIERLKSLVATDKQVPTRLFRQFSPKWIARLLSALQAPATSAQSSERIHTSEFPFIKEFVKRLPMAYQGILPQLPLRILRAIDEWIISTGKEKAITQLEKSYPKLLIELLNLLLTSTEKNWVAHTQVTLLELAEPARNMAPAYDSSALDDEGKQRDPYAQIPSEEEHLSVGSAGMILLHPFLPALFKQLEWLAEDNTWESPSNQERAMHLLLYLVTGEERLGEHNFLLPKVLCHWPLEQPINRMLHLTDTEKEEGDRLLNAVVNHWKALGNSSIDGLREGFLQRAGVLETRKEGYLLRVERKGQDLLLDKLPWGIGLFKLPWMEGQMVVEW